MISDALETRVCFEDRSLGTEQVLSLLRPETLGFSPSVIRVAGVTTTYEPLSLRLLQKVGRLPAVDVVEVREVKPPEQGRTFLFSHDATHRFQQLCWVLGPLEEVGARTISDLRSLRGFSSAFVFDAADVFQQSTSSLVTYRSRGWSLDSVRTIFDRELEREVVDVSQNPGRADRIPGTWIIPAWKLWLAGSALAYFSRERLLSFREAEEIHEAESAVFMRLLDSPSGAATVRGRTKQRAFRNWLEIDQLVASFAEARTGEGGVNIEEGTFESGGIRRVTICRDRHGRIAPRREASSEEVFVLDQIGRIIKRFGPYPIQRREA